MQFVKPMPFQEAVDKLGDRSPMGSTLTSSEWSDVPVALRERAFFSSQVENVRFLQRAQDALDDFLTGARETLPDGQTLLKEGSRADFVDMMREFALSEGMGPLDPEDAGGLKDITSERRLGLIFDTQTQQADDYGYWRQGQDPDVLDEFPAQRFIRVKDVKEPRETHAQFDNQVYLKTDPIWAKVINEDFGVPWGPWGWGCGHDVEDVDRDEAEQLGLVKPGQKVEPDTKSFNENLSASTNGLEPDLLAKLQNEFGDRLVIDGDTMRWAGSDAATPAPPATSVLPPESAGEDAGALAGGTPTLPVRENPVSDAIDVKATGLLREQVNAALAAIDKVHDDGSLPTVPAKSITASEFGHLRLRQTATGLAAEHIGIRRTSPWPTFTTVHEVGHLLDLEAIGAKGEMATVAGDADMKRVLAAAEKTEAIKNLRRLAKDSSSSARRHYYQYLLKPAEIWARAYSQFVAERAGTIAIKNDLAKAVVAESWRQWQTEDFKPVADAIDELFKKLGWI